MFAVDVKGVAKAQTSQEQSSFFCSFVRVKNTILVSEY